MGESAASIWAKAHGWTEGCQGTTECYYCASPCNRQDLHHEPPPFLKRFRTERPDSAKRPASPYMCKGCIDFRKPRRTLSYLDHTQADGKRAGDFGWFVTPNKATAIRPEEPAAETLWGQLISPPTSFFLAIRTPDGPHTQLQLQVANNEPVITTQTELFFTLDGILHSYTIYGLYQTIRPDAERSPGVSALIRYLGPVPVDLIPRNEESEASKVVRRGRPPVNTGPREQTLRAVVRMSGQDVG